jgi:hypothetical protein
VTGADADEPVDEPVDESVSARDARGRMPLHLACRDGDSDRARSLLKRGADVNARVEPRHWLDDGNTPLHIACVGDHTDCARLLLGAGADVHARNRRFETPLHGAAKSNNVVVMDMLLKAGASVDARDAHKNTPLHNVCGIDGARRSNRGVRLLLEAGADANARDVHGDTPLHAACLSRRTGCLTLLLEAGANMEARGQWRRTPLAVAVSRAHADCARLLLEHGADPDARDGFGNSVLARRGHGSRCASLVKRARLMREERGLSAGAPLSLDWTEGTHWLFAQSDRRLLARALGALLLVDARREGGGTLGREGALAFVAGVVRECEGGLRYF